MAAGDGGHANYWNNYGFFGVVGAVVVGRGAVAPAGFTAGAATPDWAL
jgi:hypothetical protein